VADQLLAEAGDVVALAGRSLTTEEAEKVVGVLTKLSGLFRRAAGDQQFTAGTSTVRLRAYAATVWLKQHPVVSVDQVLTDDGNPVTFKLVGQTLTVDTAERFVTVTYTHGGDVPDVVRTTIADAARQVLQIAPEAREGVTQQTSSVFSRSYAQWALGGQTRLSPDDVALAKSYRRRPWRPPIVQEP